LKAFLRQRGISFVEHDVSRDERAAADMVHLSGQQGVPVTLIGGQAVVGFNRPVIDQLLGRLSEQTPKLGVAIAESGHIAARKALSLPVGAYVGRVHADSPAAMAGLRAGDVIVELAGRAIQNDRDVHRAMSSVRRAQSVDLVYWRDGQRIRASIRF
jgi:S1-C subfamily serine protease